MLLLRLGSGWQGCSTSLMHLWVCCCWWWVWWWRLVLRRLQECNPSTQHLWLTRRRQQSVDAIPALVFYVRTGLFAAGRKPLIARRVVAQRNVVNCSRTWVGRGLSGSQAGAAALRVTVPISVAHVQPVLLAARQVLSHKGVAARAVLAACACGGLIDRSPCCVVGCYTLGDWVKRDATGLRACTTSKGGRIRQTCLSEGTHADSCQQFLHGHGGGGSTYQQQGRCRWQQQLHTKPRAATLQRICSHQTLLTTHAPASGWQSMTCRRAHPCRCQERLGAHTRCHRTRGQPAREQHVCGISTAAQFANRGTIGAMHAGRYPRGCWLRRCGWGMCVRLKLPEANAADTTCITTTCHTPKHTPKHPYTHT